MTLRWLTVLLLIACGTSKSERDKKVADKPATTATTPRPVEIAEPAIKLPRELAFEVLDPGKGERAALRYALEAANSTFVTRIALTSRELVDGTWRDASKQPVQIIELSVAVDPSGALTVRPLSGAVDASILDKSFALTLDARGRLGNVHDVSSDELVQRLLATVIPVPDEPVGDGARWRVVTALRQQQAVLKQTATYTLVSRRPTWKIAVDIQRLAEPQRIGDVELVAIVRKLAGTVEIDPTRPLPKTGKLSVESTVHVRGVGATPVENIVEDTGSIELSTSSTGR
jgi:hypothetical protein